MGLRKGQVNQEIEAFPQRTFSRKIALPCQPGPEKQLDGGLTRGLSFSRLETFFPMSNSSCAWKCLLRIFSPSPRREVHVSLNLRSWLSASAHCKYIVPPSFGKRMKPAALASSAPKRFPEKRFSSQQRATCEGACPGHFVQVPTPQTLEI